MLIVINRLTSCLSVSHDCAFYGCVHLVVCDNAHAVTDNACSSLVLLESRRAVSAAVVIHVVS